jgi:hypothetical protein
VGRGWLPNQIDESQASRRHNIRVSELLTAREADVMPLSRKHFYCVRANLIGRTGSEFLSGRSLDDALPVFLAFCAKKFVAGMPNEHSIDYVMGMAESMYLAFQLQQEPAARMT